jgi:hypothetical protein
MPNDAKLGLVLGIALVIAIGVVFFRKEPTTAPDASGTPAAVTPVRAPADPLRGPYRPARAKPVSAVATPESR